MKILTWAKDSEAIRIISTSTLLSATAKSFPGYYSVIYLSHQVEIWLFLIWTTSLISILTTIKPRFFGRGWVAGSVLYSDDASKWDLLILWMIKQELLKWNLPASKIYTHPLEVSKSLEHCWTWYIFYVHFPFKILSLTNWKFSHKSLHHRATLTYLLQLTASAIRILPKLFQYYTDLSFPGN